MPQEKALFKVLTKSEWASAQAAGVFQGSPIDLQDGFIHLSSGAQVVETVAKHFAGQEDLMLIEIDGNRLGETLKWEVSRGGDLFPHVYGNISIDACLKADPLPLGSDAVHVFPR